MCQKSSARWFLTVYKISDSFKPPCVDGRVPQLPLPLHTRLVRGDPAAETGHTDRPCLRSAFEPETRPPSLNCLALSMRITCRSIWKTAKVFHRSSFPTYLNTTKLQKATLNCWLCLNLKSRNHRTSVPTSMHCTFCSCGWHSCFSVSVSGLRLCKVCFFNSFICAQAQWMSCCGGTDLWTINCVDGNKIENKRRGGN